MGTATVGVKPKPGGIGFNIWFRCPELSAKRRHPGFGDCNAEIPRLAVGFSVLGGVLVELSVSLIILLYIKKNGECELALFHRRSTATDGYGRGTVDMKRDTWGRRGIRRNDKGLLGQAGGRPTLRYRIVLGCRLIYRDEDQRSISSALPLRHHGCSTSSAVPT